MAWGIREQPEKIFEKKARDGKTKRSWKLVKQKNNRRIRRESKRDPETIPVKQYAGWEW